MTDFEAGVRSLYPTASTMKQAERLARKCGDFEIADEIYRFRIGKGEGHAKPSQVPAPVAGGRPETLIMAPAIYEQYKALAASYGV